MRRDAFAALLKQYMPAMLAHLVRRQGIQIHRAEDLLQGFIASKLIEDRIISRADQTRGRFRSFLLTALDRYVVDQARYDGAQKRQAPGGVSLDDAVAVGADKSKSAGDVFDLEWAREVLRQTLARMEERCIKSRKANLWRLFENRIIGAISGDAEPTPYEQLAVELGYETPAQAANALVTAKRMFAQSLRATVAEYAVTEDEIESEIQDLYRILATGAG